MLAAGRSYRYVEVPFRRHGIAGVRAGWAACAGRCGGGGVVRGAGGGGPAVAVAVVPAGTSHVPASGWRRRGGARGGRRDGHPGAAAVFIGDSVMLGASRTIERTFGRRAVVDAAVGRRFPRGTQILMGRRGGSPPT